MNQKLHLTIGRSNIHYCSEGMGHLAIITGRSCGSFIGSLRGRLRSSYNISFDNEVGPRQGEIPVGCGGNFRTGSRFLRV